MTPYAVTDCVCFFRGFVTLSPNATQEPIIVNMMVIKAQYCCRRCERRSPRELRDSRASSSLSSSIKPCSSLASYSIGLCGLYREDSS